MIKVCVSSKFDVEMIDLVMDIMEVYVAGKHFNKI